MKFITKAVHNFFAKITLRKSVKDKTLLFKKVGWLITWVTPLNIPCLVRKIINVFTCHSVPTFFDHSSKSSWVLSFWRKLSPSAFSLCPSTWFSQPFPRTSSTRRMYADNWRSIWWNENGYWHKLPELFNGLPAALKHIMGPLQLSDHTVQNRQTGEQMTHWDMFKKATKFEFSLFNMVQCVICSLVRRFCTTWSLSYKGPIMISSFFSLCQPFCCRVMLFLSWKKFGELLLEFLLE